MCDKSDETIIVCDECGGDGYTYDNPHDMPRMPITKSGFVIKTWKCWKCNQGSIIIKSEDEVREKMFLKHKDKLAKQLRFAYECDDVELMDNGDVELFYSNELSALRVAWKMRNKVDSVIFCNSADMWKVVMLKYYKVV